MVIDTLQPRRGRRKEEMVVNTLQPRRGRRKEEMVVTTLPFPMLIPVDNDLESLALSVITMLPFPMLIPVDNDLKSLALSVDVAGSKTLVAQESEGGVTGRTEAASRNPSATRHGPNGTTQRRVPNENRNWTTDICTSVFYLM